MENRGDAKESWMEASPKRPAGEKPGKCRLTSAEHATCKASEYINIHMVASETWKQMVRDMERKTSDPTGYYCELYQL